MLLHDALPIEIVCRDGVTLGGHLWGASQPRPIAVVIINPATGVLARFYHRYARFLADEGFVALTYDYRGIGQSRPPRMRGCGYRWRDWGEQDFDAAVRFVRAAWTDDVPIMVVGHSVGGFLPGLAESGSRIERMLTVGAQYGWWGDYAPRHRLGLFLKFHAVMPPITALAGYFPGRRLGWLEDLPAGVAFEWAFRRQRFEHSHHPDERAAALERMAAVNARILAVAVSDDPIGTLPAIRRTLAYYRNAVRAAVLLSPQDYGRSAIGHFDLFRADHASGFWRDTLSWLRDGEIPKPERLVVP